MLSDEERKAIEYLKRHILPCYGRKGTIEFMLNDIVLNLIEKQSKEIEDLKEVERLSKRQLKKQKNDIETLKIEIEELKEDSCCMTNCVRRGKEKLFLEHKIKAKIEEWDMKDLTICYGGRSQGRTFQQAVRTEVKKILQSLLEKE